MTKNRLAYALLSGVLLFLSFPPYDTFYFSYFAFVPVLFAVEGLNVKQSFLLGIIFGIAFFTGLLYWVHIYNILALPLIITVLSIYSGLAFAVYSFISRRIYTVNVFVFPVVWSVIEYIRSYGYWGFPWGVLGYTQHNFLQLIQISSVTGVFGVSFLILLVNSIIVYLIMSKFCINRILAEAVIIILIFFGVILYGIDQIDTLKKLSSKKSIKVGIMQLNSSPYKEWKDISEQVRKKISYYLSILTLEQPDLIVTPETVTLDQLFYYNNPDKKFEWINYKWKFILSRYLKTSNTHILLGVPTYTKNEDDINFYNSVLLINPVGTILDFYHKIHLVPFGEIVPFYEKSGLIREWARKVGCSNFTRGTKKTLFNFGKYKFSTLICYEALFGNLTKDFVEKGAEFLVNITNDAWTLSSAAHYQHFTMSKLTAIQNGVPLIRVGNSGISAIVTAYGEVLYSTMPLTEDCFVKSVPIPYPKNGTFFSRYGEIFSYINLIILFLLLFVSFMFPVKEIGVL